jgi:agmatinase
MNAPFPLLEPDKGFLGLPPELARTYAAAKAVIIPYGLEASVSYGGGTKAGPQAMLDASMEVELFDEEFWREPVADYGVVTARQPVIDNGDIAASLDTLATMTGAVLSDQKFPLVFGGEHSITPGAIRPFLDTYPDLHVLHFDAHADLRDGYEGEHFSHAAAIRRVLDHPSVTLVSVGIRNISKEEIPFLKANDHRITIHWGKDRRHYDYDAIVAPLKNKPIYLTFDLDGFDSSAMPSTGTPEPGGLFWEDAIGIIRRAANIGQIVGADINELAPIPSLHGPDFMAAKLAYKILNYALAGETLVKAA